MSFDYGITLLFDTKRQ